MGQHSHFKRWGAAYLLLVLFLASWAVQFISMLVEIGNEARQHGQSFSMDDFLATVFERHLRELAERVVAAPCAGRRALGHEARAFKADALDMEQVQLDLAEIKEHLGISPRDEATKSELEDARDVRASGPQ